MAANHKWQQYKHERPYLTQYLREYRKKNPDKVKAQQHRQRLKFLELKKLAVNYKGGKCSKCSYDKCFAALDFHHMEPSNKTEGISDMINRCKAKTLEQLKPELDKTILVCANCHKELHNEWCMNE